MSIEERTGQIFNRIHVQTIESDIEFYNGEIKYVLEQYAQTQNQSLEDFASTHLRGKNVIEIGCGGRASGVIAMSQFRVGSHLALDVGPDQVKTSEAAARARGLTHVQFRVASALELPEKSETYDFALSNGVLHHTPDPERGFRELTRVLKPGGFGLIGIYGYSGIFGRILHPLGRAIGFVVPFSFMEAFVKSTGFLRSQDASLLDWFYAPIQYKYKPREIVAWFEKNGYTDIQQLKSPKKAFNMGLLSKIMFGHGYIYMMGRKKA